MAENMFTERHLTRRFMALASSNFSSMLLTFYFLSNGKENARQLFFSLPMKKRPRKKPTATALTICLKHVISVKMDYHNDPLQYSGPHLKQTWRRKIQNVKVKFQNMIPFSPFNHVFLNVFAENLTRWSSADSRWIRNVIRIAPVQENCKEQISGGVDQPPSILNIQHQFIIVV